MIVEEQGIGFRTGVRFPSAPLFKKPRKLLGKPVFMRFFVARFPDLPRFYPAFQTSHNFHSQTSYTLFIILLQIDQTLFMFAFYTEHCKELMLLNFFS